MVLCSYSVLAVFARGSRCLGFSTGFSSLFLRCWRSSSTLKLIFPNAWWHMKSMNGALALCRWHKCDRSVGIWANWTWDILETFPWVGRFDNILNVVKYYHRLIPSRFPILVSILLGTISKHLRRRIHTNEWFHSRNSNTGSMTIWANHSSCCITEVHQIRIQWGECFLVPLLLETHATYHRNATTRYMMQFLSENRPPPLEVVTGSVYEPSAETDGIFAWETGL